MVDVFKCQVEVKKVSPTKDEKKKLRDLGLSDKIKDPTLGGRNGDLSDNDDDFESFRPSVPSRPSNSTKFNPQSNETSSKGYFKELSDQMKTIDSNQKKLMKEYTSLKKEVRSKFRLITSILVDMQEKWTSCFGDVGNNKFEGMEVCY